MGRPARSRAPRTCRRGGGIAVAWDAAGVRLGVAPGRLGAIHCARKRMLEAMLMPPFGDVATRQRPRGLLARRARRHVPFAASSTATPVVWRVSTTPSGGAELCRRDGGAGEAQIFYDWAGGLIWLALEPHRRRCGAGAPRWPLRGHATLIRAPAAVRAAVDVFEPQERRWPP